MGNKKHSTKIPDSQLSLFDPAQYNDDKPLPELIAAKFGFALQPQDVDGKRYYAVQDWLVGVAQTKNPRRFWTDMKKRYPELYARCVQLKYLAADGKKYKVDFADDETLYLIVGDMDRSTGIRQTILGYLAKAGVKLDEFRRDPGKMLSASVEAYRLQGKSDEWIANRTSGIVKRNQLTDMLRTIVIEGMGQPDYATFTNVEYQGLFKRTAAELRKATGLKHTRDGLTSQALGFISIAEATCNDLLQDRDEVTFVEACSIMSGIANDL